MKDRDEASRPFLQFHSVTPRDTAPRSNAAIKNQRELMLHRTCPLTVLEALNWILDMPK